MSPVLESGYVAVIDTAVRDSKRLAGRMVAARDPDGVTVKWLREAEGKLMLVAQHTSLRFQPVFLRPGWAILGEVVLWIGSPA
jgi:hypothetical protein